MNNVRIRTIFALVLATLGLVIGCPADDALAACAPGCKICLLGVCSDAPQQRPEEQKSTTGPQQPRPPVSDGPLVLVDRENELKGLKPTDTSQPVTEWVGFSRRDFVRSFLFDFVMYGNCQSARCLSDDIQSVERKLRQGSVSDEDRDRLRKRENELRKELGQAQTSIQKFSYDCKPVKAYCVRNPFD